MVSIKETLSISIVIDEVIPVEKQRGETNSVVWPPNDTSKLYEQTCANLAQPVPALPFLKNPGKLTEAGIAILDSSGYHILYSFPEMKMP